jgi:hypothetical protein
MKVWKLQLVLLILFIVFFVGSIILCGISNTCRGHIPTINNMLNSVFTIPYIMCALNTMIGIHFITVIAIYYKTQISSYYWSRLQIFMAMVVYLCTGITLFVYPFTGWDANWANVSILATYVLWELICMMALWRCERSHHVGLMLSFTVFYILNLIVYIVLRAIPNNFDVGILVAELLMGLSVLGFLALCVLQVFSMKISFLE